MPERLRSIIDVHIVLRRQERILLTKRAGNVYASGQYCLPSGHLEAGESLLDAVVRETKEEVGIILDPTALHMVLAMHQRNPDGHTRIGFFFEPAGQRWEGEPVNAEPVKCSELHWSDADGLPADTVPYTAAALAHIQHDTTFALNGW